MDLFEVVFFLVCVYLNGLVDVNYFYVVGGLGFLIGELFVGGFLYFDIKIVVGEGFEYYIIEFFFLDDGLIWCKGMVILFNEGIVCLFVIFF